MISYDEWLARGPEESHRRSLAAFEEWKRRYPIAADHGDIARDYRNHDRSSMKIFAGVIIGAVVLLGVVELLIR